MTGIVILAGLGLRKNPDVVLAQEAEAKKAKVAQHYIVLAQAHCCPG